MASHLIGISGRKRSGKDTFAERLVSHHGFTRVAFADPLKAVAVDLNPIIRIEADEFGLFYGPGTGAVIGSYELVRLAELVEEQGWEVAKEFREVRRILQALGVAVREHVGDETWVDAALVKAAAISGPVVVTDVRFPNEAERVRFDGGKIVRVNRPGLPETDLHISETALDDLVPDFLVRNAGTVADLHGFADGVARTVLAGD